MIDAVGELLARVATRYAGRAATYFNTGSLVTPGAGAIMTDSGALAAGEYEVIASMYCGGGASATMNLQHRNAANTADVRVFILRAYTVQVHWPRITVAANERIRIVNPSADTGVNTWTWSLAVRLAIP